MRRMLVLSLLAVSLVTGRVNAQTASPFAYRGVIEGFYGPPWTHGAVLDQLAWMGRYGLNVFVHAPKDDPYQRAHWRTPYPPSQLADLLDEVGAARDAGIDWVPNLSPGFPLIPATPEPTTPASIDVCFACPSDLDVIYAKLDPFFDAGTRVLMISFDDVQKISSHPEDAIAYGAGDEAYGRMNRDLLNAVYRHYAQRDPAFRLITVPADYAGTADTPYLRGLRSDGGLDAGVDVLWTGTAVVSATISAADAAAYSSFVGRDKILVWDNYPVNDYMGGAGGPDTTVRLFLGPYDGRSADLPSSIAGILANPMIQPVASRIALGTMAEYLADPVAYDPESAWRRALSDVGGAQAAALFALADNSRSSTLDRTESPTLVARRDGFLSAFEGAFWDRERIALGSWLDAEQDAPALLTGELASELRPWLDRLEVDAAAGLQAMTVLTSQRPFLAAKARDIGGGVVSVEGSVRPPKPAYVLQSLDAMLRRSAESLANPHAVHGDRLAQDFNTLYVGENRMDAFIAEALARTVAWLPASPAASGSVAVTVNGEPVAVRADGRYAIELPGSVGSVEVIATDGAGGRTGLVV